MASESKGVSAPPAGPHTNRLAQEQSPYLLQHQHNPVDWYPWGPEALEKAKKEDKPIFLSVGYATCHWCHVMERESFEDQQTADIMNRHFVNIKVDREERPDVDRVYMTYVQAISGRGGWPMSVFLTPDLEPIYGGTYYPKVDMMQGGRAVMPSFTTVLRRIAKLWDTSKEDMKAKATSIMSQLQQSLASSPRDEEDEGVLQRDLAVHALTRCAQQLAQRFDAKLGGFGGAPKFPRPAEINSLMSAYLWHQSQGNQEEASSVLPMALFSLDKMAAGGMYDHIGGGFHRYSVDEYWHVPHFEKMLYDNPQLVYTYLAAMQLVAQQQQQEHAASLAGVAMGVLDYMRREMTAPQGGLYSAQDADSYNPEVGHKTEGFCYLWKKKEVEDVLGAPRAALFCDAYSIKEQGNCTLSPRSDPHDEFRGRNVPILLKPLRDTAAKHGMSVQALEQELGRCRQELYAARAARPQPGLDDKVVTAWNGMSISAFSRAARALAAVEQCPPTAAFPVQGTPRQEYLQCALRCAAFAHDTLWDAATQTFRRSYCRDVSAVQGFADDYAWMVCGLLDLYEAGGGLRWLTWAVQVQARMDALFWDPAAGGYFSTTEHDPTIKLRIKDEYDGAEPTASSIAASNLYRLAALLPQASSSSSSSTVPQGAAAAASPQQQHLDYAQRASQTLGAFQERLFEMPLALPQMCCAVHLQLQMPLKQVIVACPPHGSLSSNEAQALLDAVHTLLVPDKAVILIDLSDEASTSFWQQYAPEALAMAQAHFKAHADAGPTVFVCQNFTCQTPTSEPAKVLQLLREGSLPPVSAAAKLKTAEGLPGM